MSVAEKLREWLQGEMQVCLDFMRYFRDLGGCSAQSYKYSAFREVNSRWPERIQAELDKKDAEIAALKERLGEYSG